MLSEKRSRGFSSKRPILFLVPLLLIAGAFPLASATSKAALTGASAIPSLQREALIAIYNSTDGDDWTDNSGWKTPPLHSDGFALPGTEGTWYGVTVNFSDQVTGLDLAGNNLDGTLPTELANLTSLQILTLYSNNLTGSIPSGLSACTDLLYIWLFDNKLTGSIPPDMDAIINLRDLRLQLNFLTGSIPPELGNLASLETLWLYDNLLTGSIPANLGNLSSLVSLQIDTNALSGEIPEELGALTGLTLLRMDTNGLTGVIPEELGALINLDSLYLDKNHLSGSIPSSLGNLTKLTLLYLNSNKLEGAIPTTLTKLTALSSSYTDLSHNALYSTDPDLTAFLDSKDADWAASQTIAPTGVTATGLDNGTILVSWDAITYTVDAGYFKVMMSTTAGGSYALAEETADKATLSASVSGLTPGQRYYFVVRTVTNLHPVNPNIVESGNSEEASAIASTPTGVRIAGTVRVGSSPLAGVVMSGLPGSPATNSSGDYEGYVTSGSTFTVIPTLAGYTFTPPSITYTSVTTDQVDQDYAATVVTSSIKVDFNNDGQEDILWRYYGTGGYVRAWFLGYSGGSSPLSSEADAQMAVFSAAGRSGKLVKAALSDPRDLGMGTARQEGSRVADAKDIMGIAERPAAALRSVDDPRRAGGVSSELFPMSVADPRLAKFVLAPQAAAPEVQAQAAAGPIVLGGADIMPVSNLSWEIVGTGDFNKDGHVDILWRYNAAGGTNVIWYMNGSTWIGSAELISVTDLSWKIVGTGDFNKNGSIDILWRYSGAGGYNVVWYMSGASWAGTAELLSVSDTSWEIAGTGDYDKDGYIDILWRYNGTGGYDVIWYMTGTVWKTGASLLSVPDLLWKIVSR